MMSLIRKHRELLTTTIYIHSPSELLFFSFGLRVLGALKKYSRTEVTQQKTECALSPDELRDSGYKARLNEGLVKNPLFF